MASIDKEKKIKSCAKIMSLHIFLLFLCDIHFEFILKKKMYVKIICTSYIVIDKWVGRGGFISVGISKYIIFV